MDEHNNNIAQTTASVEVDAHAHHYDHFYQDPTFWVGISFVIVVASLCKPIYRILQTMLDNRIAAIKKSLKDAKQLELDAKKLFQEYEEKISNLDKEIKDILDKSKKEIEFMKQKNVKALEDELKRKKEDNEHFITNLQKQAKKEINDLISDNVIKTIKKVAKENLDDKYQDELIDASIKNINDLKS